ncbi:MAG: alkaline phosphatase family protein [Ruminococcus sp.]|nr:alkaline phosphatase family protein [Ruminococcus sp.]
MRKTIFVLLDACQYDAGTRNLGYLEHLIDYGKGAKYKVRGELPSLSRPMYATLLTGLPVYKHGIAANETVRVLGCDNLFSMCKSQGGVTAAAAYLWVSELYNHVPFHLDKDRIQIHSGGMIDAGIYYWEDSYPDSHLFADGEYLRTQYDPDFILYHSMGIDNQGHLKGAGSKEYEGAIAAANNILSLLMETWMQEGYQIVITADHGMNELGLHGGTDAEQRDIPLYIFSSAVKAGRFEGDYISELNVAPLLCRLLDIPVSPEMIDLAEIALT